MILYYIDGQEVNERRAKSYYEHGVQQTSEGGYHLTGDAHSAWKNRGKSEEAREIVFNLSAIQDQGGLEIVIEED